MMEDEIKKLRNENAKLKQRNAEIELIHSVIKRKVAILHNKIDDEKVKDLAYEILLKLHERV